MGVLDRVGALLVGRPYGYTDEQRADLHVVLSERARRYRLPVVTGMDFGHTSPMLTLPVGCRARLDGARERVVITEGAVT